MGTGPAGHVKAQDTAQWKRVDTEHGTKNTPQYALYICDCCNGSVHVPEVNKYCTCRSCGAIYENIGDGRITWANSREMARRSYQSLNKARRSLKMIAHNEELGFAKGEKAWIHLAKQTLEDL